jgi:hypothetical protein
VRTRRHLLKQLQPFGAHAVFEVDETGRVIIFCFPAATGEAPEIDLARIYGVTTFELK